VYPSVLDRIGALSQMRVDIYNKLPADHPLQPPVVEPLNVAPADAKGSDEPVGSVSANTATSSQSNQPHIIEPLNFAQTQTQTETETEPQQESPTNIPEQSVIENLVSHYSGELPEFESELQKASEVASDEVASESPQQQTPEPQTATTSTQIIPDHIEMTKSSSTSAFDDISETNIPTIPTNIPTIPTNNQPSPSNLALQPITPPKPTKIPFPPTMYLDSSLLADVCENIFQELNRLIQSRSDLIHQNSYEQSWKRLKERVENILNALQRTCIDDQDMAQQKLKDWLKGVTSNLQEVQILKTWVKHPLCLRQRNETDFIPAGIHPRELNVKLVSTELVVVQRNAELENENRQLKKELL